MPTPDEGDVLLGYRRGCTQAPGVLDYQREQMVGNTMHVQCVKRLLLDLPPDDFSPNPPDEPNSLTTDRSPRLPKGGVAEAPVGPAPLERRGSLGKPTVAPPPDGSGPNPSNEPAPLERGGSPGNHTTPTAEERVHRVYTAPGSSTDDIIGAIWNKNPFK